MSPSDCEHASFNFLPSINAREVGYHWPTPRQRAAASTLSRKDINDPPPQSTFPAPLVLPEDDLSWDPRYDKQSLLAWTREKERNAVTSERNVIYVAAPPRIDRDVEPVRNWSCPQRQEEQFVAPPSVQDVMGYLSAFYHGLPVKLFSSPALRFTSWNEMSKSQPKFIGLRTAKENIQIRTRPSPDKVFPRQLNLDDLLDTAISILPKDAYALLMLVDHDLFEDADDDFCCGRAYGGSRVAVVSSARYNPYLDIVQNIDRQHAWPASHCSPYMRTLCDSQAQPSKPPKVSAQVVDLTSSPSTNLTHPKTSPMHNALTGSLPPTTLQNLYLSRLCRTASHELGHCFGLDHCVYYACVMQGTASIKEDARQPPYLCPVDLAKVLKATGADVGGRYEALRAFCGGKGGGMFGGFEEWLGGRMGELRD